MKTGKKLSLEYEGEKIAEITSYTLSQDELQDYPEPKTVTVRVTLDKIDFDETWLVAYQARMYAEMFKN